ncbi:hypothetical protein LY78DRAFT_358386 [Colletotrichum sublineola]|nr:hypothetical protein LY78DRAFT_358386 [Colletotrichum sublineola]
MARCIWPHWEPTKAHNRSSLQGTSALAWRCTVVSLAGRSHRHDAIWLPKRLGWHLIPPISQLTFRHPMPLVQSTAHALFRCGPLSNVLCNRHPVEPIDATTQLLLWHHARRLAPATTLSQPWPSARFDCISGARTNPKKRPNFDISSSSQPSSLERMCVAVQVLADRHSHFAVST